MAQLTASDYNQIRDWCYKKGTGKEELKALATLPPESVLMAIFQAAEDRTIAAFALFRADMEAALGIPSNAASLALARKVYAAYVSWKLTHV